jgi:hypothetical protein
VAAAVEVVAAVTTPMAEVTRGHLKSSREYSEYKQWRAEATETIRAVKS